MDRIFGSGAAATPPTYPTSPSVGYPQAANPGLGVPSTKTHPWWFYMITEEIRNVITAAGLTPDGAAVNQLQTAIRRLIDGGDYKASVRVATTANIALTGVQTIDGVSVVAGDRVLVKNQTTGAENGIYVAAAGAWSRAEDANSAGDLSGGMLVPVESGTAFADTVWMLTTDGTITLGTTAITFEIKSGGAQSLSANGYIKLPGGLIIQFNSVTMPTAANTGVAFTLPIAFPNSFLAFALATDWLSTTPQTPSFAITNRTNTSAQLYNGGNTFAGTIGPATVISIGH